MRDEAKAVLEWEYTPSDFFEDPVQVCAGSGRISIEKGWARGSFDASEYARGADFRDKMHELLRQEFLIRQLFTQRAFKLDKPAMTREYSSGQRDVTVFVETLKLRLRTYPADITVGNAKGNVALDTRTKRLADQRDFRDKIAKLVPKYPELVRMLDSFRNSIEDEKNCFVYLDEIREALVIALGFTSKKNEAGKLLGWHEWKTLGRLANGDPNSASRHRGKHVSLQLVSDEMLNAGRDCAQKLIHAYVEHRSKDSSP